LLDISRLDSGHMKLVLQRSDLIRFLKTLAIQFSSLAQSKKIRFVIDLPDNEKVVWYDEEKITKVVQNLLSNAFKFTPEGGVVTFRLRHRMEREAGDSSMIRLIVADTGSGIPAMEREKIFHRFYRAGHHVGKDAGGTGIGLALTRELVHLMHGEITVRSLEGKGSIFIASIPLGKDHLKDTEYILKDSMEEIPELAMDQKVTSAIEVKKGESGHEELILIVEDHAELRSFMREKLSQEFTITEARDGKEGLQLAYSEIPDLIITDVMMPEMDGMEFCRNVKGDERTSHIPVIMLTAKSTSEDKKEGLELGADDYIIKPFEMEELEVRIKNLLVQRRNLREKYSSMIGLDWASLKVTTLEEKFLRKLSGCIIEHIDDDELNVGTLSQKMSMSREHLFRKLKALTGNSPGDLIRTIRLKAAASLLEKSDESITRISLNTGFSNPSHFASLFRKFYGKSPLEYRKEFGNNSRSQGAISGHQ
jgi:DNA-binding response OmpR family regulator/two-component sensor histidine kinase